MVTAVMCLVSCQSSWLASKTWSHSRKKTYIYIGKQWYLLANGFSLNRFSSFVHESICRFVRVSVFGNLWIATYSNLNRIKGRSENLCSVLTYVCDIHAWSMCSDRVWVAQLCIRWKRHEHKKSIFSRAGCLCTNKILKSLCTIYFLSAPSWMAHVEWVTAHLSARQHTHPHPPLARSFVFIGREK